MSSTSFRIRTLARVAGPLQRRGFATSFARYKDTKSLRKLYDSADEAVADIPSGSTILSGGEQAVGLPSLMESLTCGGVPFCVQKPEKQAAESIIH